MSEEKTIKAPEVPEKSPAQKLFEKDIAKTEQAMKVYDIDQFILDTDEIKEVVVPNLGIVKYKALDYTEARNIYKKCRSKGIMEPDLQGLAIIAEMMHKADGKTTYEKLLKKSLAEVTMLSQVLGNSAGFLPSQPPTTSK